MIDSVGSIESISPVDRPIVRLAEWARLGSQNLVESQGVPYTTWVGQRRTPKAAESDSGGTSEKGSQGAEGHLRQSYIQFVIDHASNDVTIRVIDRASGEVIRTIPPDQLMSAMHELNLSTGALLETVL